MAGWKTSPLKTIQIAHSISLDRASTNCYKPSKSALIATRGGQVWPRWRSAGTKRRAAIFKKCSPHRTADAQPTLLPVASHLISAKIILQVLPLVCFAQVQVIPDPE
jgi:hypothetical protein